VHLKPEMPTGFGALVEMILLMFHPVDPFAVDETT
jgi:hypothetical protein